MGDAKGEWVSAGRLIAVIDDDESMRIALVGLLRSLGYDVRGFPSAEDFLDSGPVQSCSCVITDIQMPGMSGLELQRRLAARRSSLPVIMITARLERDLEERALAGGSVCFLRKPFEMEMLVGCLEEVLKL